MQAARNACDKLSTGQFTWTRHFTTRFFRGLKPGNDGVPAVGDGFLNELGSDPFLLFFLLFSAARRGKAPPASLPMGLCGNSHLTIPVSKRTTFPVRAECIAASSVRQISWFLNSLPPQKAWGYGPSVARLDQDIAIRYISRMGSITYKKKALKGLAKMPRVIAAQFRAGFGRIAARDADGLNVQKLQGRGGYRLRIGSYRAIYEIEGETINVLVLDAGPRGDIYK
jgi:mRNA interferase RelE/StbE